VTLTATTYDGTTNTVLAEEVIPISLTVEAGPWWAATDDWLHAVTSFASTTAGLITTVGGAVVVIAGGVGWMRRKRAGKTRISPRRRPLARTRPVQAVKIHQVQELPVTRTSGQAGPAQPGIMRAAGCRQSSPAGQSHRSAPSLKTSPAGHACSCHP
jgi:hypothetical protein